VNVLLDTHAFIWALGEFDQLSPRSRNLLLSSDTTLVVSVVSFFEIALKYRLGKLPGVERIVHEPLAALADIGAVELLVTRQHALFAGSNPSEHKDPFDRLIGAQAVIEGIPIVTIDRAFASLGADTIW
jgi:PIN domain nuclease of toxin-antitoxin system